MGLKLKISPITTISGVLEFDGSTYIQLDSLPNVNQDLRVTFKMYLTKESGYYGTSAGNTLLTLYDNTNNARFVVGLNSSDFYVTVSGFSAGNWVSSLSGHSNKIIEVEIIRTAGGSDWEVDSVTFNGIAQTDTGANTFSSGGDVYTIGSFASGFELDDAYIWDIKIYDSGDSLIHSWLGQPDGNLNSAWEDQVASIDGSISGDPPFFTSDIAGSGGGSVTGSVLSIVPDVETYTGVADFQQDSVRIFNGESDDFGTEYKVYRWKMWLDKDSGWANTLFQLPSSTSVDLKVILRDSSIVFGTGVAGTRFSISGLDNQILDCALYTGYSSPYIENFEVNGSFISASEGTISSGSSSSSIVSIGGGISTWDGSSITDLEDATVWDWSVETSTGTVLHSYKGYPAGNTLGAWVDDASDMDADLISVSGTRNIIGTSPGSGSVTGSVLLIAPPSIPVPNAPILYRPLDTSILGTTDPSLAWESVSDADTYWVQLDDDPGFGSLYTDVSGLTDLYYNVSSLDTSTAYYWRVAATNTGGTGDWSEEWEFYTPQPTPAQTIFTLDSSFTYTIGGKTPLWDPTYYDNHMTQIFTPSDGGGAEKIQTLSIDAAGVITQESSISYSYPNTQTELDGILYVSKLFTTISSFVFDPTTGAISKWKDNNSPIVSTGSQRLASTQGKLIGSRGFSGDDIVVWSYTPDASGSLTRDSSLTFPTSYEAVYNNKVISGENFVYLMRFSDPSVVTTDILTISGGVLTDTGYDVSLYTNYDEGDMWFEGFESSGNLYLSYNGLGIYHYSINQSTGEPTYVKKTTETTSVGIQSGIVGTKLINESNDQLPAGTGHLKSFDLDTFDLDGSILRDGGNSDTGSGIIAIDNSTFVTSNLIDQYTLDTFSLSFS